ncbi:MAG: hypothetical protein IJ574_00215 [Bacilli bacterium]|nr:hypothetical protein [Bacilli bacterium]
MVQNKNDLRILYSYGINNSGEEILIDLETLKDTINDKDNCFIIVGSLNDNKTFNKPLPSIDEIRDLFFLYQKCNEGNVANSFHALVYKYAAIKCGANRFMFNKCLQAERLIDSDEIDIYNKYNSNYGLSLKR